MTRIPDMPFEKPEYLRGFVRRLRENDSARLAAHWSRLDWQDRQMRFNGAVADETLQAYLSDLFSPGSIIAGYIENGDIRGVAELRPIGPGSPNDAELAFSIEAEWKRRGIGTRLMRVLLRDGGASGYSKIVFETNSQNVAMKALARKFGALMQFREGETFGTIKVPDQYIHVVKPVHPWFDDPWAAMIRISAGAMQIIISGMRATWP